MNSKAIAITKDERKRPTSLPNYDGTACRRMARINSQDSCSSTSSTESRKYVSPITNTYGSLSVSSANSTGPLFNIREEAAFQTTSPMQYEEAVWF